MLSGILIGTGSEPGAKSSRGTKCQMRFEPCNKETLQMLRNERGLTQDEMAVDSGIPLSTIKKLEAGISNASLETMGQLGQYHDVFLYAPHPGGPPQQSQGSRNRKHPTKG
ncbi:MAG: hypothetical protein CVV27_04720 [Candidatus Melainabacteria bacterium HGW-Melainabacteria-1]|nr:MAG: hypothetical protein CVV27_04720 [Candidatus Melainabacteria bacterium HGW-Melainabacteria-1]